MTVNAANADTLLVAGRTFHSRLLIGTGKYRDFAETLAAVEESGAEIVTVAIRRVNIGQNPGEPNLLDVLPPDRFTLLPNTAGCYDADSAVRTCQLARELLDGHDLIKLEVLGDEKTLFPDIPATLIAARALIDDGFKVMVYTNDDPIMAKRFAEMGCVAVMPLAAPIGSGMGIRNPYNIRIIVENATVPIIVDAGVGTASDAALAMELGCDGVLMNTAIAAARQPVLMASAMRKAIEAGREAYLAGRMPRRPYGAASSPVEGLFLLSEHEGKRPHRRGVRSFVLREGRMTSAQTRALAELSARFEVAQPGKIDFDALFGRHAPVHLEIGSGNGGCILALASANPGNNYIGIEVHRPGVGSTLLRAAELQLSNLRIIQGDAVDVVTTRIPVRSLDGIYVFFADPWPKKRHRKRRLLQADFLSVLHDRLQLQGRLHIATDWQDYADHIAAELKDIDGLINLAAPSLYAPRPTWRPLTRFERRGLGLGHMVRDFTLGRGG